MRMGKMVLLALLGFCASAYAQYDENVTLDLSVLDNLGGGYSITNEPLFPVLPKETKKVRAKKTHNKTRRAEKQQKVVEAKTVQPSSQEKDVVVQEGIKETAVIEPKEKIVVVEREPVAVESEVVPVDVEPSPVVEQAQELSSSAESFSAENNNVENSKSLSEVPAQSAEKEQGLLIDEKQNVEKKLFSLTFAPDSDELTMEQMSAIDNEVSKYKNDKNNKIAIYSYNIDDGVDSFRKKRVSLNRALAVRTYLIRQEYKNFSIKVINVNSGSDKENTVELEEI